MKRLSKDKYIGIALTTIICALLLVYMMTSLSTSRPTSSIDNIDQVLRIQRHPVAFVVEGSTRSSAECTLQEPSITTYFPDAQVYHVTVDRFIDITSSQHLSIIDNTPIQNCDKIYLYHPDLVDEQSQGSTRLTYLPLFRGTMSSKEAVSSMNVKLEELSQSDVSILEELVDIG